MKWHAAYVDVKRRPETRTIMQPTGCNQLTEVDHVVVDRFRLYLI